jgi:hypothetical protein
MTQNTSRIELEISPVREDTHSCLREATRVRNKDLSCQPHVVKDVTLPSLPGPYADEVAAIELHSLVYMIDRFIESRWLHGSQWPLHISWKHRAFR